MRCDTERSWQSPFKQWKDRRLSYSWGMSSNRKRSKIKKSLTSVLQAQFFSKLPFGDHVIQKSRQLSNVGRQNKVTKFKKKSYFPWWHLVGYYMKRKLMKFQDGCSTIVVECTYALLQVFTQTERSELYELQRKLILNISVNVFSNVSILSGYKF